MSFTIKVAHSLTILHSLTVAEEHIRIVKTTGHIINLYTHSVSENIIYNLWADERDTSIMNYQVVWWISTNVPTQNTLHKCHKISCVFIISML